MNATSLAKSIASDCIGYRVRMLNRIVSRVYDDALRPLGLRFSQMNILTVIVLRGPILSSEVGRALSLEKSTLSRNLRLMEENGWIVSEPAGAGRRLQLTRVGQQLYRRAAPAWQESQDRITAMLGKHAADAVRDAADLAQKEETPTN